MGRKTVISAPVATLPLQLLLLMILIAQHPLGALAISPQMTSNPSQPLILSLSSESVALHHNVTIRCHINANSEEGAVMAQSSMNLYCPATAKETFCFQNCRPQEKCTISNDCWIIPALKGVECRRIIEASGEIVHEYTVKNVTADWMDWAHPGFACHSATEKTDWIRLKVTPEASRVAPSAFTTTTTTATTTTPITTATASSTTSTTPKPRQTTHTRAMNTNSTTLADGGVDWLNFLQKASSGGFWTLEMFIIIAFAVLALSLLINCFCCVKWIVRRHHKNRRKAEGSKAFSGQSDFKDTGIMPPMTWYPADPRILTPSALASHQITPRSMFRRSIGIPDESLLENLPSWSPFESVNASRSHPEGKTTNGSSLSQSAARISDSGSAFVNVGTPQPVQILSNPALPMGFEPFGWSGPTTPRSRQHTHRLRHQFVPSYYVGMKRASSRETVFSERPMSEIGFEPSTHHQHHYIPVMVGCRDSTQDSQPQLAPIAAYGTPLCGPADVSFSKKPGAGDGASAGGDSGSPRPRMTVLLPATVASHQYGVMPPPSSSTERSSAPLLKVDLTLKSTTMTPEAALEEGAGVNEAMGKSAAEVRMWLQSMPTSDKDCQPRLQTKLADSLNTDYDAVSDWSEREPMLMREKPSSEEAATTE